MKILLALLENIVQREEVVRSSSELPNKQEDDTRMFTAALCRMCTKRLSIRRHQPPRYKRNKGVLFVTRRISRINYGAAVEFARCEAGRRRSLKCSLRHTDHGCPSNAGGLGCNLSEKRDGQPSRRKRLLNTCYISSDFDSINIQRNGASLNMEAVHKCKEKAVARHRSQLWKNVSGTREL
uniref:Uncharacterized protein n=1 Tax=Steinernema glaseri TaxID=37863 RepID=A0A1I7Z6Y8_9BILA